MNAEPSTATMCEAEALAYEAVRSRILDGRLSPGQKVKQCRLADEIGLSRTPLVKALKRLEAEYLVRAEPDRGFFVRKHSPADLIAIYQIREGLEPIAARLLAYRADETLLATLRKLFRPFKPPIDRGKWQAYLKADREFHRLIVSECGNPFLVRIVESFNVMVQAFSLSLTLTPNRSYPQHMNIIEGLMAADGDAAEAAMRLHLAAARRSFVERLQGEF
jgi:DNA-binding GntR family transcriptional regulator